MMYAGSSHGSLAALALALFWAAACGGQEAITASGQPATGTPRDDAGADPSDPDAGEPLPDPGDGDGDGDGDDDVLPENCGIIKVTVRDFTPMHADFESSIFTAKNEAEALRAETGLVEDTLGADHKPVFRSVGPTRPQITSASSFASWYNDDATLNRTVPVELKLEQQPGGLWVYDSAAFFPVDGQGFGNFPGATDPHNFHFTTEIHLSFAYELGQRFTFRGDDDLWLFVGGKLALDLGGLHLPVSGTLDMDAMAAELQLAPGDDVAMDIFHAERHTGQSNFHVETNIQCLTPVL